MPLSGPLRNNKRSEVLRCLASFFKRAKYEKFNRQIRKGFADTGRIFLRHHGKKAPFRSRFAVCKDAHEPIIDREHGITFFYVRHIIGMNNDYINDLLVEHLRRLL